MWADLFCWTEWKGNSNDSGEVFRLDQDHEWTLSLAPQDWELSENTLAGMPLGTRYETYYELAWQGHFCQFGCEGQARAET